MIPEFQDSGTLPVGVHVADISEIRDRYALNPNRHRLFGGLVRGLIALRNAQCEWVYLNGSFVTNKPDPSDYDACWEMKGVVKALLDPVLLDFSNRRAAQKAKYFGEFFPAHAKAEAKSPFRTFFEFFQQSSDTGEPKGIIAINLSKSI